MFDHVPRCYNSDASPIKYVVNMEPVPPPQRKRHMPQHTCNHKQMIELQTKFDDLEKIKVFEPSEDLGME